jgi:hypothetical protein
MNAKPSIINVTTPPVTVKVEPNTINVHPPDVHFHPPDVHVTFSPILKPPEVTVGRFKVIRDKVGKMVGIEKE